MGSREDNSLLCGQCLVKASPPGFIGKGMLVGILKVPCYPMMEMGRLGNRSTIHKTRRWYEMLGSNSPSPRFWVPVSRPSSYNMLPPISITTQSEVIRVQRLKQSLIQECGIKPGTYSELDPGLHPRVEAVYDGLVISLLEELCIQ